MTHAIQPQRGDPSRMQSRISAGRTEQSERSELQSFSDTGTRVARSDRLVTLAMDPQQWYDFLLNEYFKWKYTAANRYATTTMHLKRYVVDDQLSQLFDIKERLLSFDTSDISCGLKIASGIRGLGTAGASGLLALLYPNRFATVDQFVVKALRSVSGLQDAPELLRMNPEGLTHREGQILIRIMTRNAQDNNATFGVSNWTPRKIGKILWTYGRD